MPAEKLGPYGTFGELSTAVGDELYGRSLSPTEQAELATALVEGDLGSTLAAQLENSSVDYGVQGVARLYAAYFLRNPDPGGFEFWLDSRRSGWSPASSR